MPLQEKSKRIHSSTDIHIRKKIVLIVLLQEPHPNNIKCFFLKKNSLSTKYQAVSQVLTFFPFVLIILQTTSYLDVTDADPTAVSKDWGIGEGQHSHRF